jgi:hypothetical protein
MKNDLLDSPEDYSISLHNILQLGALVILAHAILYSLGYSCLYLCKQNILGINETTLSCTGCMTFGSLLIYYFSCRKILGLAIKSSLGYSFLILLLLVIILSQIGCLYIPCQYTEDFFPLFFLQKRPFLSIFQWGLTGILQFVVSGIFIVVLYQYKKR